MAKHDERLPKLGEKTIRRPWEAKSRPSIHAVERPWVKALADPRTFQGQRTIYLDPLADPMESLLAKERMMLMRRDSLLNGEDEKMATEKVKKKPVEFFREGAISLSVWLNKGSKGDFPTFSLTRSYKQGDVWKYSTSLGALDLPKAVMVLQKAMEKYKS